MVVRSCLNVLFNGTADVLVRDLGCVRQSKGLVGERRECRVRERIVTEGMR